MHEIGTVVFCCKPRTPGFGTIILNDGEGVFVELTHEAGGWAVDGVEITKEGAPFVHFPLDSVIHVDELAERPDLVDGVCPIHGENCPRTTCLRSV